MGGGTDGGGYGILQQTAGLCWCHGSSCTVLTGLRSLWLSLSRLKIDVRLVQDQLLAQVRSGFTESGVTCPDPAEPHRRPAMDQNIIEHDRWELGQRLAHFDDRSAQ